MASICVMLATIKTRAKMSELKCSECGVDVEHIDDLTRCASCKQARSGWNDPDR